MSKCVYNQFNNNYGKDVTVRSQKQQTRSWVNTGRSKFSSDGTGHLTYVPLRGRPAHV